MLGLRRVTGDFMTIRLHRGDLPDDFRPGDSVAIDTETLGLNPHRDRLCLVQLSTRRRRRRSGADRARARPRPPISSRVLADPHVDQIFHFARFDLAILQKTFGVRATPVYCTKIASKLTRTYTDRHGLKDLVRELLGGGNFQAAADPPTGRAENLSEAQLAYAASDVLHLHALREKLDAMLAREGRTAIAQECFGFLPARAELDLLGWPETDIFAHM